MRILLILCLLVLISSCRKLPVGNDSNAVVLEYEDFGPQVIAYQLLGMYWWQWDNHGDSRPTEYDIHVVVYKNINLHEISERYPVNQNLKQDYRYIKYNDALEYLYARINEDIEPAVTERLKRTLSTIQKKLGDQQ